MLKVCDIDACAAIAHDGGARLIIDNTFATPYLCQPLKHGADIVVHSATKFLGGHADAMGGIAISRDETDSMALIGVMKLVGGVLSPWEAHEILRGVKTLIVRMDRHCDNARALAGRLRDNSRLRRVYFSCFLIRRMGPRQPNTARSAFRALVSIELRQHPGGGFPIHGFVEALRALDQHGDVFTSVLHPATASHRDLSPARRKRWESARA